MVLTLHYF